MMNDYLDDKEFYREMTRSSLERECNTIINSYMKIYDEYYKNNSRDSAFLKDLTDAIKGIGACLEVYARDGKIHPNYAVEKLTFTENLVRCVKHYFESSDEFYKNEEK